jgi:predicted component of type VI protein secretion system
MDIKLVPERGAAAEGAIRLRKEESLIGRGKGSDVRIPSSEVSRRHCLLNSSAGYVVVEDLGSANGTLVNDEPIETRQIVRPGDRLQVGPVCFVVEYQLTQEGLERMLADEEAGVEVVEEVTEEEVEEVETVEVVDDLDEPIPVVGDEEETERHVHALDDEDGIPLVVEASDVKAAQPAEVGSVQMPEGGDIRDILTEMEGPGKKKRRTEEE